MAEPLRLLDTSVIIRYLSNDIPHLAQRGRDTPALHAFRIGWFRRCFDCCHWPFGWSE
jgi:hypothetical protein